MNRYRLGLIGAGLYGKELIRRFQQEERAGVTWVNSASAATTQAAAQQLGIEQRTLNYRDILADPAVDAVVIATRPYLHAQQLTEALARHSLVCLDGAVQPAMHVHLAAKHLDILFKIIA